ncbi:MAG: hypothetical protein AAF899_09970, partial [Pseudomonadota bacterium]
MRSATIATLTFAFSLCACGTTQLFTTYDLPESPEVESAPYPRLVDVPVAPAPGTFTAATPDPVDGAAVIDGLAPLASAQAERAAA